MAPGSTLSFGRAADRDVRFGDEPEDLLVSRHAGRISTSGAMLLVHNDSRSQQYYLTPLPGREQPVGPGMVVGLPQRRLRLIVLGQHDASYEIALDRVAAPSPIIRPDSRAVAGVPTAGPPTELAQRERRMLAALCEPLLRFAGDQARAATYAEIARRLQLGSAEYVRRVLGDLRDRLSTADGVPRLQADGTNPGRGHADALADWAVRTGIVDVLDLDLLTHLDKEAR
jgi:hypothetical protein